VKNELHIEQRKITVKGTEAKMKERNSGPEIKEQHLPDGSGAP
jgi:hypothetical protein